MCVWTLREDTFQCVDAVLTEALLRRSTDPTTYNCTDTAPVGQRQGVYRAQALDRSSLQVEHNHLGHASRIAIPRHLALQLCLPGYNR
jgi:hypothetical protein